MNNGTVKWFNSGKVLASSQTMQAVRIYLCIFQRLYQLDISL